MATKTVEAILKKEAETDKKISEANNNAELTIENSKKTAGEKADEILSDAKKQADEIIAGAQAEADKIYENAKANAANRRESILKDTENLKKQSIDTVIDILF